MRRWRRRRRAAARIGQRAAGFAAFEARSGLTHPAERAGEHLRRGLRHRPLRQADRPGQARRRPFPGAARLRDGRRRARPRGWRRRSPRSWALPEPEPGAASGLAARSPQGMLSALAGSGPAGAPRPAPRSCRTLTAALPPEVAAMLGRSRGTRRRWRRAAAGRSMADAWEHPGAAAVRGGVQPLSVRGGQQGRRAGRRLHQLLGPGGKIEAFFNQYLKPFVDTSQKPWQLQPPDRAARPVAGVAGGVRARGADPRGAVQQRPGDRSAVQLLPVTLDAGSRPDQPRYRRADDDLCARAAAGAALHLAGAGRQDRRARHDDADGGRQRVDHRARRALGAAARWSTGGSPAARSRTSSA